jgi:hypothetical protein
VLGPLLRNLSTRPAPAAIDTAVAILAAVHTLVGDHVEHNTYFIDFPRNVQTTAEF